MNGRMRGSVSLSRTCLTARPPAPADPHLTAPTGRQTPPQGTPPTRHPQTESCNQCTILSTRRPPTSNDWPQATHQMQGSQSPLPGRCRCTATALRTSCKDRKAATGVFGSARSQGPRAGMPGGGIPALRRVPAPSGRCRHLHSDPESANTWVSTLTRGVTELTYRRGPAAGAT